MSGLAKEEIADALHSLFDEDGSIDIVLIYGSCAREEMNEMSDVDIAVHSINGAIDDERLVKMSLSISDALHKEVDLVDLSSVEGLFLYEIMTGSVRIKFDLLPYMRLYMEALYFYEDFLPIQRRVKESIIRRFIDESKR